MKRHLFLLATFAFLTSCRQNTEEQHIQSTADSTIVDSLAILNDPKNNLNIQTTTFSEIDSSGILMLPLAMRESERGGGSFSYKEIPNNTYWNIIFFNGKTNESHLLSERKMLIGSYDYKYSSDNDITQRSKYIFYLITSDDYNKDRKLTNDDPTYLFVSDKQGNNFRQISPVDYDLQSWQFINSINKVILTAKKDSDRNNKFDEKDEVTTFEIDIDNSSQAKEVFSPDFKNKLKILFDRDWKRLKE